MTFAMSELRQRIVRFIRDFIAEHSYPPSVREIMRHFGFKSPRAVSFHLEKLEAEGYLERDSTARGLRLRHFLPSDAVPVPIYGMIPAGLPEQQTQSSHGQLLASANLLSVASNQPYALRVKGDSMIGARIFDGDIAIVDRRPAKNNDLVVALVDGDNTLKRLVQEGRKAFFRAENPAFPDVLPVSELAIQGVVVGIYRPMP
jgi:repressor LexA